MLVQTAGPRPHLFLAAQIVLGETFLQTHNVPTSQTGGEKKAACQNKKNNNKINDAALSGGGIN